MDTGKEVEITEATAEDASGILQVQKHAFREQGILYGDMHLPPLSQTLDELLRDFDGYVVLKAIYGNRIVGTVRGSMHEDTCHIGRLAVHPDYQNRGIGKSLMRAIEAKFNGVRRYELFTGHLSRRNLALYEKLGYREFDRKPQGDKVMLICMEKKSDT